MAELMRADLAFSTKFERVNPVLVMELIDRLWLHIAKAATFASLPIKEGYRLAITFRNLAKKGNIFVHI